MREIKFQVMDTKDHWHTFSLGDLAVGFVGKNAEFKPETWRQYTGLKDKNGKEIYEGDIVYGHMNDTRYVVAHGAYNHLCIDNEVSPNCYGVYIHNVDDAKTFGEHVGESLDEADKYLVVMGNIYENAELLE